MSYLDTIKEKKTEKAEHEHKSESLEAFQTLSKDIQTLLSSLEKTGAKTLDKDFITAVKGLEKVATRLSTIRVTSDQDIKDALNGLAHVLANLDVKPTVNVKPAEVTLNEREIDFKPLIKALEKIEAKAPEVSVDMAKVEEGLEGVKKAIKGMNFPVANYVSPFKDGSKSTQALVDTDGHVQADILSMPAVTIDTTGLATSAKQDTVIGHLDGVEALLGTIDADTSDIHTNSDTLVTSNAAIETAVEAIQAGQLPDGHNVTVDNASLAVTGTFWQATQPVSGTVTANLGATDNGVLDNIDTNTSRLSITGIGHGVTTVTTAGTDVALAASTACKRITIQAQTDNTGVIAVGGSGVDATVATGTGILLFPGDAYELDIDNLADVFIDSSVNGEGVRYAYFT